MRGVAVGTGKRLTEVGQRLGRWFTTLLTSRDLQESKARFEEAQRAAHVGYWVWNLDTDRVTWSDETYRIYGLMPQNAPTLNTGSFVPAEVRTVRSQGDLKRDASGRPYQMIGN